MREAPLRIAQVPPLWARIPPATYGGIELIVQLLCEEMTARGHEVTLFGTGESETRARLRPVCEKNLLDYMAEQNAAVYEYYVNAAMARVLQAAGEFDIIHFHIGVQWLPLATLTSTPSIFTLHTLASNDDAWAAAHFPGVEIAGITRYQVRELSKQAGRKLPVVYNGCDFDRFDPSFEAGSYLAFLGRMSHDKNPLDAIRIAHEADLPIVLAGQPQGGQDAQYFTEKIEPLIDGKRVRWIGPVNHAQKNEFLRNAAALVFPVQWPEPFGLVMIEAMACGTPVVARLAGSVPEVVDAGVTGFYVEQIGEMASLIPKAIALDRRGVREHARGRFGFEKMVDGYLDLYRQQIGRRH